MNTLSRLVVTGFERGAGQGFQMGREYWEIAISNSKGFLWEKTNLFLKNFFF